MSISWPKAQNIIRGFSGTVDASTYGRSGFKIGKKFLCAFNQEENAIAIRISFDERELLMSTAPKIYYVTDHYRPHPAMLVSLKHVSEQELRKLIERRWRETAPAKLVKAYDEEQSVPTAKPRAQQSAKKIGTQPRGNTRAGMTPAQFRKLALSLPDATEGAHGGHPDFRVGNKLFASLGYPTREFATIMLTRDEQLLFVETSPDMFEPVKGGWGLKGATTVVLKNAKPALIKSALLAAWRRKAPTRQGAPPARKARRA